MRSLHVAIVFGLAALTAGCGVSGADEERSARGDEALNLAAPPPPPPPADRYIIRAATPGCNPINGTGGTWTGAAITAAIGTSPAFCTYTWTNSGKAVVPALAPLRSAAVIDPERGAPYVVADVRVGNPAAPASTLTAAHNFTGLSPHDPPGAWSPSSTFVFGGGTPAAGAASLDLTGKTKHDGDGVPICEICGGYSYDFEYLWFVLPPDAVDADGIIVELDDVAYDVGPTTVPVFYTPAPTNSATHLRVSWYSH